MAVSEHDRIQDLLGVYAADAVSAEEAAAVERHLEECARCAREVAEHLETLALLAPAGSQLRPRPLAESGIDLSIPAAARFIRGRRGVPPWTLAVAAALVVVLGAVAVLQTQRADDLSSQLAQDSVAAAAERAVQDPGARRLSLTTESGEIYADVALLEDGLGFLVPRDLPALSPDQTYQLWALKGPERTSLLVAGARPEVLVFRTSAGIDGLALTQEVAGGVPQPTKTPMAVAFLRGG